MDATIESQQHKTTSAGGQPQTTEVLLRAATNKLRFFCVTWLDYAPFLNLRGEQYEAD